MVTEKPKPILPGLEAPFDHELALLRVGQRRIVKREYASSKEAQSLQRQDWTVAWVENPYGFDENHVDVRLGRGESRTAFVGRREDVALALELEQCERHGQGAERHEAITKLGALLGYPSCCTERYCSQAEQSESASFDRLLGLSYTKELAAYCNIFVLAHNLLSHFPCTLACEASEALGKTTFKLLEAQVPFQASVLLELLGAPITIWDRFRFLIEHPHAGLLTAESLTHTPRLLSSPAYQSFAHDLPARPEDGVRLCFRGL